MKKTVMFVKERETKRTIRYQELPAEGEQPIIGYLYVQKWFVRGADRIAVTVELVEKALDELPF